MGASMDLASSRLVLTGASGGIGREVASLLAESGARLLLVARQPGSLQELERRHPGQVQIVVADLTRPEGRDALVAAVAALGGLDGLIHAAGVNGFAWLEHQDEEVIGAMIDLNVTSTLLVTRRLLPWLRQAPEAVIVNVGSIFGSIGHPGFAAYCASKFALRGFSEALRRELADTRVRVRYIAPRATRTAMNRAPVVQMNERLGVAMDAPRQVAVRIVQTLRGGRFERFLGWPERLFVRINSLWPGLVDRAMRRQLPLVRDFARPSSSHS